MENGKIDIYQGLLSETTIAIVDIQSIETPNSDSAGDQNVTPLSFLTKLTGHNVLIQLNTEATLSGLYGTTTRFKTLALFVDDHEQFVQVVEREHTGCKLRGNG